MKLKKEQEYKNLKIYTFISNNTFYLSEIYLNTIIIVVFIGYFDKYYLHKLKKYKNCIKKVKNFILLYYRKKFENTETL